MKIFKQPGPAVQVVIFLVFLIVCCLCAMGTLIAVASLKGRINPSATIDRSPTQTDLADTPVPVVYASLTPLPGQWTDTPTPLPGQSTKTPTRTPIQRTIAPFIVPVLPSITLTPEAIFLETPTPEIDEHLRQAQIKTMAFLVAYNSFGELHQQLIDVPTLVIDEKWKAKMAAALSQLEEAADQLAAVELPDPDYAVYASYLDQLASETGFMVTAYLKGIDHYDSTSMQIVIVHLRAMNEALNKADQEFRAVKSRLATPGFSPLPSSTPTP